MASGKTPGDRRASASAATRSARTLAAVLLVAVGAGAVIYGAAVHAVPVLVEPAKPPEPAPAGATEATAKPPAGETGPALDLEAAAARTLATLIESEPALMREVTVGGVARLPTGEIKRTCSGKAPPQCPT